MNIYKHLSVQMPFMGSSNFTENRPLIKCADGFEISVQASCTHYCSPKYNNAGYYDSVELGFPSIEEPLITQYAKDENDPTNTVYGYVPIELVDEVIRKHGGIISTENII